MSEPTKGDELHELVMAIRYDLTSAQSKITEALRQIGALNLNQPARVRCPHESCALVFPGPRTLGEHLYQKHDGPTPQHWINIEAMSLDPPEDEEPDLAPPAGSVP